MFDGLHFVWATLFWRQTILTEIEAKMIDWESITYMSGFGNEFESEAKDFPGALPRGQNNPQKCRYNLFAEQLSGTAFTAPRASNRRSWLYKLRPSVCHTPFKQLPQRPGGIRYDDGKVNPNQIRWTPFECSDVAEGWEHDFVEGMRTLAYSNTDGSSSVSIHIYIANANMRNKSFVNADGDFLIVPQTGTLLITTEFGLLQVEPNEIAVIQQGMKFSVSSKEKFMRGYVLEVQGNHFELPNLGAIGANGLANPRDFQVPTARVGEDIAGCWHTIQLKFQNEIFYAQQEHSPYDCAAWFGNYTPYKYSLDNFVSVNTVSVDHMDPCIFTVLTCPSLGKPGTAIADFVIFPPRWDCASNTFRPPYYHRNCMTEFMGLIEGQYLGKNGAFAPGGASLHQSMIPHGPDYDCFVAALNEDTSVPKRIESGMMAFMFETSYKLKLTEWARTTNIDKDYLECWQNLSKLNFPN